MSICNQSGQLAATIFVVYKWNDACFSKIFKFHAKWIKSTAVYYQVKLIAQIDLCLCSQLTIYCTKTRHASQLSMQRERKTRQKTFEIGFAGLVFAYNGKCISKWFFSHVVWKWLIYFAQRWFNPSHSIESRNTNRV